MSSSLAAAGGGRAPGPPAQGHQLCLASLGTDTPGLKGWAALGTSHSQQDGRKNYPAPKFPLCPSTHLNPKHWDELQTVEGMNSTPSSQRGSPVSWALGMSGGSHSTHTCPAESTPSQPKVAPAALKHHICIGFVSYPSPNQYFKHKFTEIHFCSKSKHHVHCKVVI